MSSKQVKKAITIYLTEEKISDYKKACLDNHRNMASQGEALIDKFILNSKRKLK